MQNITNLYDLRSFVSEKKIDLIVTQYLTETIARSNILRMFEEEIYSMSDEHTLSVADIKEKLMKYENDVVNSE